MKYRIEFERPELAPTMFAARAFAGESYIPGSYQVKDSWEQAEAACVEFLKFSNKPSDAPPPKEIEVP